MAHVAESLGKASLELSADLGPLERDLKIADARIDSTGDHLKKLERQAELAEKALKQIKVMASQGQVTGATVGSMQRVVNGLKDAAAEARMELKDVKVTEAQAEETAVAGHRIESTLDKISRKAGEARRALIGVRLAGAGGAGGGGGLNGPLSVVGPGFGRGVGPFGSGYGRLGLVGTGVLAAGVLGPAAGPGALGLLAGIPTLATVGAGALGTLALAFAGVGKAISGDKKAFEALQPSQQAFVLRIRSMKGWLDSLRETAGKAVFPGLTKGLEEAASPGTLNAITTAVNGFGTAIGAAGEKVGRYFGSEQFRNIFGPLMEEGAHELGTLADAALSLFDAVGVLGRSGIPLMRWITDSAAAGARLVDSFTRAQEASGSLGHGMDEAQDSLRIVARLGLALVHVAGALGQALYPVSKIAVKDLTDGLESLAASIHRNQGRIREIVGGALKALQTTIETIVPLLGKMFDGLEAVATAIGGWDKAFEIVIGGYLALKLLNVADAITKIGTASGEAGAAGEVGLLQSRLSLLARMAPIAVAVYLLLTNKDEIEGWLERHHIPFAHDSGIDIAKRALGHLGIGGGVSDSPPSAPPPTSRFFFTDTPGVMPVSIPKSHADIPGVTYGSTPGDTTTSPFGSQPPWTKNLGPKGPKASLLDIVFPPRFQAALLAAKANAAGGGMHALERLRDLAKQDLEYLDKQHRTGKKLVALQRERATIATLIETTERKIARAQEKAELKLVAIPQRLQNALGAARAALGLTTSSPDSAASLTARATALGRIVTVETAILDRLKAQHVTGKALVKQQAELGTHTTARGKMLGQLTKTATQAGLSSIAEGLLGIGEGPTMSGQVASLRQRERRLLDKVIRKQTGTPESKLAGLSIDDLLSKAGPFLSKTSRRSLGLIGKEWELYLKNGFLPKSVLDNVRTRLQQFNDTVTASFDKLSLSAAQVARKQERVFLESFQAIVSSYAPNAGPAGGAGVMATHLYDIKHETREQTKAMKKIATRTAGAASDYAHGLGMFG